MCHSETCMCIWCLRKRRDREMVTKKECPFCKVGQLTIQKLNEIYNLLEVKS